MNAAAAGVLLLGNHPPPYGGVPSHIEALARHLATTGWRVHVLSEASFRKGSYRVDGYTVHCPGRAMKVANLARGLPRSNSSALLSRSRGSVRDQLGDLSRANLIGSLVRRHRIELLSAYHVLAPGLSAAWVAERMHLPLVTTVFGEIYDNPGAYRRRIEDVRYVTAISKAVLSCSHHCASSMKLLDLPPAQPIHYGVDTARFTPKKDGSRQRERLGIGEDARVVLFVGRMVEEMGLGTLLTSVPGILKGSERNHVLIAGASGSLTPNARAIEEASSRRVHILENFDPADLAGLYASSDVVVAPSTNERACLGLAIIEAMASSKPVVACRVGGTSEVVADGVTGRLVAPSDPAALVDAVTAYLDDASTAHAHGRAGRTAALTHFDLDIANRKIESLFLSALDRS